MSYEYSLEKEILRMQESRDFPNNTCPASRHVQMIAEDLARCPVLFSDFPTTQDLNQLLLDQARSYDDDNPNLITKLIPAHYLREGYTAQGFTNEDGTIGNDLTGASMPGTGVIGSPQIISAMLLVYAKFFDELKMFVDHFSNLQVHLDPNQSRLLKIHRIHFLTRQFL
jgi:hypothetical protein